MSEIQQLIVRGSGLIYLLLVCDWETEKNWFEVSWGKNKERFRTLKKAYARFWEIENELYGRGEK